MKSCFLNIIKISLLHSTLIQLKAAFWILLQSPCSTWQLKQNSPNQWFSCLILTWYRSMFCDQSFLSWVSARSCFRVWLHWLPAWRFLNKKTQYLCRMCPYILLTATGRTLSPAARLVVRMENSPCWCFLTRFLANRTDRVFELEGKPCEVPVRRYLVTTYHLHVALRRFRW